MTTQTPHYHVAGRQFLNGSAAHLFATLERLNTHRFVVIETCTADDYDEPGYWRKDPRVTDDEVAAMRDWSRKGMTRHG